MEERATIFGADAAAYDRFRPGYPDEVVDLIVDHADGQVARVLEVGAGTGKATAVFASRGLEVVAVEPDQRMSAVLESRVNGRAIEIVTSTFEELDLDEIGRFDALFAAAAFHWTDPATRWERTAALVRPGGVVAFFGVGVEIVDPGLSARVDEISAAVLGVDDFDVGAIDAGKDTDDWPSNDLRLRPEFTDVRRTVIPVRTSWTAGAYVSQLGTVSVYKILDDLQRARVLDQIRAALPVDVEIALDVTVHLARRT